MSERKPPGVSFEDWIERRIRTAQQRGAFDNLPGFGKPIPDIDRPHNEWTWVAKKLKQEGVDTSLLLPPALALAKELEDLPARLRQERSEKKVREIVLGFNERVRQAHYKPQEGPPLRVQPLDLEQVVANWRRDRAGRK